MSQLKEFVASLKGSVYQPTDEGYDLSKWAENAKKLAKYIVTPLEAEDIAKAIKFARSEKLPIAVRGGGHSTTGASATEGLLIDMRKMGAVLINAENKVAYVQGGAQSHAIEVEAIKFGLATTVGICSQVGIGGYATGAGIGFSTGQYGLAVDNVISATVVLADGTVVEASDTENPDLYWGIRGGGCNFGVVAEFRMKLHPQSQTVYSFSYIYVLPQLEAVVGALQEWLKVQTPRESVSIVFGLGPDGNPYCIANGFFDGTLEEGETSFKPFLDIGPVNKNQGIVPYEVFGTLADHFNTLPGNKVMVGAKVNHVDYPQFKKTYDTWFEVSKKAPASAVMYEFYHMEKVASVPVDATAYPHRHLDHDVLCGVIWTDPAISVAEARETCLGLKAAASGSSSQDAQDSVGYVNYADLYSTLNETDEYARKLFGPNYPRLQEIKKKYDPDMVWNTWFNIRPAA